MENQNQENKEKIKAAIFSFVLTFCAALATKLLTMLLSHDSIDSIINYLAEHYSFWFQILAGSGAAAFVTRHFIGAKTK